MILLTIPFFFKEENICSKKAKEIFCRWEISDKLMGLFSLIFIAISTKEVTANLPFDVNFIFYYLSFDLTVFSFFNFNSNLAFLYSDSESLDSKVLTFKCKL